jgi:SpoVK/Ycf46/Vps4 family AAA+-type ATPase
MGAKDDMPRGDLSTENLPQRARRADHAVVIRRIELGTARPGWQVPLGTLLRLRTIARRGSRRRAILALFAGGTGRARTRAAAVIARDLGRDLYRVDLAVVMSKYISETERNLKRAFDAAEASGGVLLFDEADALFGKRSSLTDAHDRYSQPAINHLFRLLKSRPSLVVLSVCARPRRTTARTRGIDHVVDFRS